MHQHDLARVVPVVIEYFQGERREMIAILVACAAMAVLAAGLFWATRDGFAKGLLLTVLASAAMLTAMAVGLLIRDPALSDSLVVSLRGAEAPVALASERARVTQVVANYPKYRLLAGAVGLAALLMLALSRLPWLHGVAAGLLLLVVAQTVIDRYSEQRARTYLVQLQ